MCHDQNAAVSRQAYRDKTALLERMLWIWKGCRQGILERRHCLTEVDMVFAEVAGRLGRVLVDDHGPSIAEIAIPLMVCPTLGLSCEAPKFDQASSASTPCSVAPYPFLLLGPRFGSVPAIAQSRASSIAHCHRAAAATTPAPTKAKVRCLYRKDPV